MTVDCDCLYCAADADPENAEMLRQMADVYPGGPNCKLRPSELVVTIFHADGTSAVIADPHS